MTNSASDGIVNAMPAAVSVIFGAATDVPGSRFPTGTAMSKPDQQRHQREIQMGLR